MAKVSDKELNECIAEAIVQVLKEDWEDDVVMAAMNDKKAKKAFDKDKKKEDDAQQADDEKIETSAENDAAQADDEEEEATTTATGENVRTMSYQELKNILATAKRGTAIFRAATRELMDRDAILADKDDILSGELVKPYGWDFDENGYPVRTHEFRKPDYSNDTIDMTNSNGTNFHWLSPKMDIHGNEIGEKAGVGIPNADWA